ncbi:uncharacterized protein LOC124256527 [Haliotis rubra]|uniref:uncharacterized protein LOC124256527 n=1 Tax=Haliotis rubra TaxID=36100 RepID=UPI001EE5E348|nr:uncharacterized protein LOC124256527 [Haliotis rubra]
MHVGIGKGTVSPLFRLPCCFLLDTDVGMQMYKDRKYETVNYDPKIKTYDGKVKKYEVKNYDTIKRYNTVRKYDKIRNYDKIKPYTGYKEYVPPWSRDHEPYERKPAKEPEPKQKKPAKTTKETPPVKKEPKMAMDSRASLGSIQRSLHLFRDRFDTD